MNGKILEHVYNKRRTFFILLFVSKMLSFQIFKNCISDFLFIFILYSKLNINGFKIVQQNLLVQIVCLCSLSLSSI